MTATEVAVQMGALEAAMQAAAPEAAMWAVASATGTRSAAQGAAMHVEAARRSRTLGVRGACDGLSASSNATADESLVTGSN